MKEARADTPDGPFCIFREDLRDRAGRAAFDVFLGRTNDVTNPTNREMLSLKVGRDSLPRRLRRVGRNRLRYPRHKILFNFPLITPLGRIARLVGDKATGEGFFSVRLSFSFSRIINDFQWISSNWT